MMVTSSGVRIVAGEGLPRGPIPRGGCRRDAAEDYFSVVKMEERRVQEVLKESEVHKQIYSCNRTGSVDPREN